MNWLEVNEVVLRYDYRAGKGPCLLLIHEMGGSLESWDAVCAELPVDQAYLRYDTRGAGLSEKIVADTDIDTHVDDLAALIDALEIPSPLAACGVAVGAAIAIRLASRRPRRVSHLIGLAPACGMIPAAREPARLLVERMRASSLHGVVANLLDKGWPEPLRQDSDAFERFRWRWRTADTLSFAAIFAMLVDLDLEPDLASLTARTILVAGDQDQLRPPREIDRLASFNPAIESLHVASGHFMPVQSPLWVARLLTGFVRENRSGASIHEDFTGGSTDPVLP